MCENEYDEPTRGRGKRVNRRIDWYEGNDTTNIWRDNKGQMKNAIRETSDAVPTRNKAHELPTTRIKNYAQHAYHDRARHV